MTNDSASTSRRDFVANIGMLASTGVIAGCAMPGAQSVAPAPAGRQPSPSGTWDLSWIDRLATATDRAVFDWPSLGDPVEPMVMEIAARYLDNCQAVYRPGTYEARVVLNVRTQAIPAALRDAAWQKFALGGEYNVKDPATKENAVRNPFWSRGPGVTALPGVVTLQEMVDGGAIVLVCDFALGHLSRRLATKQGRDEDEIHRELRAAFVPGAFAVPSGMFGLVRAQNAGCAYMRL